MSEPKRVGKSSNGTALYECVCPDCGVVRHQDKRKLGKPCHSCAMKRRATHGRSGTRLYRVWAGMVARCTYESASHYEYYGGRGIAVCDEWLSDKTSFFEWALKNGYQEGMDLDRRDVDGNYGPANCRFITHRENSQLRSNARCTRQQAAEAKQLLAAGIGVGAVAAQVGIPYMSVWHISKGNTWHNA